MYNQKNINYIKIQSNPDNSNLQRKLKKTFNYLPVFQAECK